MAALKGAIVELKQVLNKALKSVELEESDMAAKELALILAEQIDNERAQLRPNARTVSEISAKLTTILVELQMTPKARKAVKVLIKEEANGYDADAAEALRELQGV